MLDSLFSKLLTNGHKHATGLDGPTFSGQVPVNGVIMFFGSSGSIPNGFVLCDGNNGTDDMTDHFVLGASVDGDVSATGGVQTADITHTHAAGTLATDTASHTHDSGTTGAYSGTQAHEGSGGASSVNGHTHPYSINTDAGHSHASMSGVTGGGTVTSYDNRPAFTGLLYIQRVATSAVEKRSAGRFDAGWFWERLVRHTHSAESVGQVPLNGITIWSGSVASIPAGYSLCNGGGGTTPDLRDRFVKGVVSGSAGTTGGANTVNISHTHTNSTITPASAGSTSHSGSIAEFSASGGFLSVQIDPTDSGPIDYNRSAHPVSTDAAGSHTHGALTGSTAAGGSSSVDHTPTYYALAYIQRTT